METLEEVQRIAQQTSWDRMTIFIGLAITIVFFLVLVIVLKKIFKIRAIEESLKQIHKALEENNEKLKELIEDVNTRKERQANQQQILF